MADEHEVTRDVAYYDGDGRETGQPGGVEALPAFLRARLDEREAKADAAKRFHPTPWHLDPAVETTMDTGRWVADANDEGVLVANGDAPARFYADNDPAFVLADVAAKRKIVNVYAETVHLRDELAVKLEAVPLGERSALDLDRWQHAAYDATVLGGPVRLLALPFAGHPDYDEIWRP